MPLAEAGTRLAIRLSCTHQTSLTEAAVTTASSGHAGPRAITTGITAAARVVLRCNPCNIGLLKVREPDDPGQHYRSSYVPAFAQ